MSTNEELKDLLSERINIVRENISDCCREFGRNPDKVTLVGVSKVFPVEYAEAAFISGLKDLAENKPQDLKAKFDTMAELNMNPNWHLIGTLQKNKVKYVVGRASLIHSVDSLELAAEINRKSEEKGIVSNILIQVNVSGEESKHGFAPSETSSVIEQINGMSGLSLHGLMTMAPKQTYDGEARKVFADTYKLYESLKAKTSDPASWNVLSMGMSQDYKWAIAEGATHIRIGTAIFGDRTQIING